MQNNQSGDFSKSGESKKLKNLPPLNQKATPNSNQLIKVGEVNPAKGKRDLNLITAVSCSVLKKQRKFVVDEYDQKAIVLCQFCGGQTCPQQDFTKNKIQPNAIQGLHSNWITQNILATQRPSNRLIKHHNLLQMFQKYNINSILNLQQPGEHPYCGDGIDPMIGFSYDPQLFFNRNIRFQNQFWEDMTSTSFQQMMKIMNVFYRSITQKRGKIAVHCHAGRGRTLMAINAWLIYNDRMTAQQTIDLAILKRQGVLTRTSQRDFLRDFEKELQKRWKSYILNIDDIDVKTFSEFVTWQNDALLKSQRQKLNETSFVHGTIMTILRNRMQQQCRQIIFSFLDLNDKATFGDKKWDKQHQHRLVFLKSYLDKKRVEQIKGNEQIRVLVVLLEDFYDSLPFTPISLHAIDKLREQLQTQKQILKNESLKRHVKKEALTNKILKRWVDIVKERENNQTEIRQESKMIEQQNRQGQIGINSRVQYTLHDQKQLDTFQFTDKEPIQNLIPSNTGQFLADNNEFPQLSYPRNAAESFIQLQNSNLYMNLLAQPSIVHEVGVNSLCTFIDFIKFAMELLICYRNSYPKQTEEHFKLIQKCLLAKFSMLLQSKKRYFPVLFKGSNLRQSILTKKIQKLDKYSNENIKYMAEHFMKNLMEELQTFLKDQVSGQQKFKNFIFKIQKVNSNVVHFSKSYSGSSGKFFSANDAKKVYDDARI